MYAIYSWGFGVKNSPLSPNTPAPNTRYAMAMIIVVSDRSVLRLRQSAYHKRVPVALTRSTPVQVA